MALTVVDANNPEPVDQDQGDFDAAMDMPVGALVVVAAAYMRRLRADANWDEVHEKGDQAATDALLETMFNADYEARGALGMDEDGPICDDCAAAAKAADKADQN
jgi:hypothetical protein